MISRNEARYSGPRCTWGDIRRGRYAGFKAVREFKQYPLAIWLRRREMNEHQSEIERLPSVFVIGNFQHEGLSAKIESQGFRVVNRSLMSRESNWRKIIGLMREQGETLGVAAVFLYVPTTTLLQIARSEYDDVRPELLSALKDMRSIVFVHEDNLRGSVEPFPWQVRNEESELDDDVEVPWWTDEDREQFERYIRGASRLLTSEEWKQEHASDIERALAFLESLAGSGIEISPFRKRSDVTIRMFEVLEEAEAGIFLRLYVPHGRYQSEQFEDFLTLFSRYLRDVEKKEFSVDVSRTSRGTTYVFKGRGDAGSVEDLRSAIERFDKFLEISQIDPQSAVQAIEIAGASREMAAFVVEKYARSMRRLTLEMRHEYQRKKLLIEQALEADVLDADEAGGLALPATAHPSSLFSIVGNVAPVTINISAANVVNGSSSVVEGVVSGNVTYSSEDRQILLMLEGLSDRIEALKLRSELERLKDPATSQEQKRTSVQKLKAFLFQSGKYVAKKVDEVGTQLLVNYLEGLISGRP